MLSLCRSCDTGSSDQGNVLRLFVAEEDGDQCDGKEADFVSSEKTCIGKLEGMWYVPVLQAARERCHGKLPMTSEAVSGVAR